MPRVFLLLPLSPLLVSAPAAAQGSAVVPSQYATTEAPGLEQEPFAYDRARHVQYVDQSLLGAVPNLALINRVSYRRDTNAYTAANMPRSNNRGSTTPIWQVRMGNTTQVALNPTYRFPTATDPEWSTVFVSKPVSFPSLPMPASGTAPFDLQFPLDVPFLYTGGNLGIDHFSYETVNRTYSYFVDALGSQPSGGTADLLSPTSLGCPPGQNRALGYAPNPGGDLALYLYGAPPQSFALAGLAFGTTTWNGTPLPYDMTPLGLPGCWIYVGIINTDLVPISSSGHAEYRVPVPARSQYAGMTAYAQWAVFDDRVNPAFPLATSDAVQFVMGTQVGQFPVPMSIVSAVSFLANNRNGFVFPGRGPVFELTWL